MPLALVGINHLTAPLSVREQLAFSGGGQRDLLGSPAAHALRREAGVGEFVFLSTCNRTELYAAGQDAGQRLSHMPGRLLRLLAQGGSLEADALAVHAYEHVGVAALRHLCHVAAGLDSMVLGESEILGQVNHAHETAAQFGVIGPVLEEAFRTAVRAGRRARTETGICRRPASVSTEAVRLLADVVGDLAGLTVLIVGTGKMGRLAGEALRDHGVRRMRVVSRTSEHAAELANQLGADALPWHQLAEAIGGADAIFCSTGAPHAVVTRELVETAQRGRPARRRTFIDIAVPRDVEPGVAELPGVDVYDLDALQERLQGNLELRRREVPAVERIVDEEVRKFEEWRHTAVLRPLLAGMHGRGETIRQHELERMMRRLGPVTPETRQQLEAFSRSLVSKLLHEPTRRLRETLDQEEAQTYTHIARELFGLDGESHKADGNAA
jgi:glutamyl-tRNA reductase